MKTRGTEGLEFVVISRLIFLGLALVFVTLPVRAQVGEPLNKIQDFPPALSFQKEGIDLYKRGRYQEAAEAFRRVVSLNPTTPLLTTISV